MAETDIEFEFKRQLKKLKQVQGSGTQLVSVYIPAGAQIHETAGKLREEMSQASNIKSKQTRTNVTDTLEKILQHFKVYKKPPKNGIAIFAGNISDNESKTDIQLFALEPPQPLKVGTYRCDSKFFIEPLDEMLENKDSYGIVVMDGREATLAIAKGTYVTIVKKMNSMAHAKHKAGGQSARRYERLIEESIEKYYQRVGESMDSHFLGKTKGVIVGGPGPTKDFFMKSKTFNYQIKILGCVDTGYTDDYGIREVLAKSSEILAEQEAIKEKVVVDQFIKEVVNSGLATYGEKEVRNALVTKQASKLLISEGLEHMKLGYICDSCNNEEYKISKGGEKPQIKCKCGSDMRQKEEVLLFDDLIDIARGNEIEIMVISTNTIEGAQFLSGFTGLGAFLRYKR